VGSDVEVRSFRSVFALERRIYQIDTLRLNPGGIPLCGIVYTVALVAISVVAGRLPGLSWFAAPVPWYFRYIAFPAGVGGLLTLVRIEGRPFHTAAIALVAHRVAPQQLNGSRANARPGTIWRPPPILCLADGSGSEPRMMRYTGPGAVLVSFPHDRVEWSRGLTLGRRADISLHPVDGSRGKRATALELAPRAVLLIASRPLPHGREART
jgi:hypothetical protein